MNNILKYLESIHPLPQELQSHLQSILRRKEVARKGYLLRQGQVCQNIYFIEKGLLRCYSAQGDSQVCTHFHWEGELCTVPESFYLQTYSRENIQALESTVVYYIHYDELKHLQNEWPSFNRLARILTAKCHVLSERRMAAMRLRRAGERYTWLTENFPELVERVPAIFLASYIGISETMFSLVRNGRVVRS
jgi:CRP/FNR family transcriptional regulator, anaerobic regulatory protein